MSCRLFLSPSESHLIRSSSRYNDHFADMPQKPIAVVRRSSRLTFRSPNPRSSAFRDPTGSPAHRIPRTLPRLPYSPTPSSPQSPPLPPWARRTTRTNFSNPLCHPRTTLMLNSRITIPTTNSFAQVFGSIFSSLGNYNSLILPPTMASKMYRNKRLVLCIWSVAIFRHSSLDLFVAPCRPSGDPEWAPVSW